MSIRDLPPLLAIIAGHDYEQRDDGVVAVCHADGREYHVCSLDAWPAHLAQLEAAERERIARILALRPKVAKTRRRRLPPAEGIAGLRAAGRIQAAD